MDNLAEENPSTSFPSENERWVDHKYFNNIYQSMQLGLPEEPRTHPLPPKHTRIQYSGGFKSYPLKKPTSFPSYQPQPLLEEILPQPKVQPTEVATQSQQASMSEVRNPVVENCELQSTYHCDQSYRDLSYYKSLAWNSCGFREPEGQPLARPIKPPRIQPIETINIQSPAPIPETIPEQPSVKKKHPKDIHLSSSNPGIRAEKLATYVNNREKELTSIMSKKFRAKPVPEKCKSSNLYQKILQQQESKRRERKKQHLLNIEPFRFDERPVKPKVTFEEYYKNQHKFKARPVPKYPDKPFPVTEKHLPTKGQLPARVWKEEKIKEAKKMAENVQIQTYEKYYQFSFKPARAKAVPNFERLHRSLSQRLDQHKHQHEIIPQPPKLSTSKPKQIKMQPISESFRSSKKRNWSNHLLSQTGPLSKSTLKHQALVQLRRKEKEQHMKKMQDQASPVQKTDPPKIKPYIKSKPSKHHKKSSQKDVVGYCQFCQTCNPVLGLALPIEEEENNDDQQPWRTNLYSTIL